MSASVVGAAELIIDGGTLSHIFGTTAEQLLAEVGAQVECFGMFEIVSSNYCYQVLWVSLGQSGFSSLVKRSP